jgi:nitroimidazol reductase NimA-like FMN-containing flavoprotein (pyridoxamine 5'-phosphate oxidase superfamily)
MFDPINPNDLELLAEDECLELLRNHDLGRIALVVDGKPLIFPVNYEMSHRVVVFRTARGTKLTYAPGASVAFEIDAYDTGTGTGWSVLIQGTAVDATTAPDDVAWTSRGATPHPLAPGIRLHQIAIDARQISGRRFIL